VCVCVCVCVRVCVRARARSKRNTKKLAVLAHKKSKMINKHISNSERFRN